MKLSLPIFKETCKTLEVLELEFFSGRMFLVFSTNPSCCLKINHLSGTTFPPYHRIQHHSKKIFAKIFPKKI